MKKILKITGIMLIFYSILCFIYKFITAFPSNDALFIENNLYGIVFNILAFIIILISAYIIGKTFKNNDKFMSFFGIFMCSLINGILYFFSNIFIFSLGEEIDSLFIKNNAISMIVCAFSTFVFSFIFYNIKIPSKHTK